jgi:hypothetical protein
MLGCITDADGLLIGVDLELLHPTMETEVKKIVDHRARREIEAANRDKRKCIVSLYISFAYLP